MLNTYLNGFYETRPLREAEMTYGTPESSQTLINVTNGKLLRLLVAKAVRRPLRPALAHERTLDFRAGTLESASRIGDRPHVGPVIQKKKKK